MATPYTNFINDQNKPVPQQKPVSENQVKNNAGGYTFQVSDKTRLERFLILGADGPTYYTAGPTHTEQNAQFVIDLIKRNQKLVWETVKDISDGGRAFRNSPAIFTTALMFKYGTLKDEPNRVEPNSAKALVPYVCRTSTHLYELLKYLKLLGGLGRAKRSAVAAWYLNRDPNSTAFQAVKYRQRDGWTHRDVLKLAHPKGVPAPIGAFMLGKDERSAAQTVDENDLPVIRGFKFAQEAQSTSELVNIALSDYPMLSWEMLPTQFLKEPEVWKKLFYNGQLNGQALVRNITRLSRIGAFDDLAFAADYAAMLNNLEMIRRTRLHPLNYLNALVVYTDGQLNRKIRYGSRYKDWITSPIISDALDSGFNLAFKTLTPANKRTLLAIDVSGSMDESVGQGLELTATQVSAAMAMATARTEPMYLTMGFASSFRDLGITSRMTLREVTARTGNMAFGATDCGLPMRWALDNKVEIDTFVIYTDNETWAGEVHPHIALEQYRQKMSIDARLAVVGITATKFTIANPQDRGMLDVVGADSNLPALVADFSAGRI